MYKKWSTLFFTHKTFFTLMPLFHKSEVKGCGCESISLMEGLVCVCVCVREYTCNLHARSVTLDQWCHVGKVHTTINGKYAWNTAVILRYNMAREPLSAFAAFQTQIMRASSQTVPAKVCRAVFLPPLIWEPPYTWVRESLGFNIARGEIRSFYSTFYSGSGLMINSSKKSRTIFPCLI